MIIITSRTGSVWAANRSTQNWFGSAALAGSSILGVVESCQRLDALQFVERLVAHDGLPQITSLDLVPRSGRVTAFRAIGGCVGDALAIQFLPLKAALTRPDEACLWVTPTMSDVDVPLRPLLTAMLAGALRQSNTGGEVSYDSARAYIDLPTGTSVAHCERARQRALVGASFEAELGRYRNDSTGTLTGVHFGDNGLTSFAPVDIPRHRCCSSDHSWSAPR